MKIYGKTGPYSVLQGEMTVFRAVETWLCARREEMAKEGEEYILHIRHIEIQNLENWIPEYGWRSSGNTGAQIDEDFRRREH